MVHYPIYTAHFSSLRNTISPSVFFPNDLGLFQIMSSRLPKNIKKSASKRDRSQDSQRSLTPAPGYHASRNIEVHADTRIPAFLRQSKAGKLLMFLNLYALI